VVSRREQASKSTYLLPSEVAEVLQVSPPRRSPGGPRKASFPPAGRWAVTVATPEPTSSPWRSGSRSKSPPELP
jgi:hypothetical protein